MTDVTHILSAIEQGDPHAAEQLLPLVYEELRKLRSWPVPGYGKSWETTNRSSAVARTCHFFQIACALRAWMSHGVCRT